MDYAAAASDSVAARFFAACLINRRTVSVGCAPLLIQYSTRSALRLISAGSRVGLYVPRFSRYDPSRFDCFSLTTMRYDGRFFAPVRINLIANNVFLQRLAGSSLPLNENWISMAIVAVSFSSSSGAMVRRLNRPTADR